jgi:DNA-binding GntR family transcriptional regulator
MNVTRKIERAAAPLRQQVVKMVREDILNGHFVPGQRLIESALCDAYGVSRTVIREALRQLETEHLIRMLPSKGPIVTVLTAKDITSIYLVRASLEGLAGRLFALNAEPEDMEALADLHKRLETQYRLGNVDNREEYKADFYRVLLAGGKNEVLEEMLRSIHARIAIFRRYAFIDEERMRVSIAELDRILAAAGRRDPDEAAEACAQHIIHAGELAIMEYDARAKDTE